MTSGINIVTAIKLALKTFSESLQCQFFHFLQAGKCFSNYRRLLQNGGYVKLYMCAKTY